VSLPEADLPKVVLPEVRLPGEKTSPDAPTQGALPGADSGDKPAGTQDQPPAEKDDTAKRVDTGTSTGTTATGPQAPAPSPVARPADDPSLLLALGIGGAALLLALAALVIVVLRRRSRPATTSDPLMPKAFLNDIGGATEHKSYELGAKPIIVGRLQGPDTDAASYVVIDESTVGRRHALLEYKDHSFWVSDQNSLNGTFVNNSRIDAPTRLKHGDRIRFHKHEFEFLVLDMFETDRTMMSETVFAKMASEPEDDDATVVRESSTAEPSPEDPTVTRP
jgi:pSer/pThr/pTyr-binding forkhead associated (FHA) protein